MRANRYLHIAIIGATLLFLVLWQTAAAGPPEKQGNPGLPRRLAKVSELNDIVANQQETILQQAARIEEFEDMLQNFAPVPQTGQTSLYHEGDDGDLQMGVQWPDPRFTDNGDGTVTDHLTGLIWLKNANCFGAGNSWYSALDACNELADGDCGLSDGSNPGDWRLPNVRELFSLIDHRNAYPALPSGHPFTDALSSDYWSSTTLSLSDGGEAIYVDMGYGIVSYWGKDGLWNCCDGVWPVRDGNLGLSFCKHAKSREPFINRRLAH